MTSVGAARQGDRAGKLDEAVTTEDKEILLQALKSWGALDSNYAYKANLISADRRGYDKSPGGGLNALPVAGEPIGLSDILKSRLWGYLQNFAVASLLASHHRCHHPPCLAREWSRLRRRQHPQPRGGA